MIEKIRDYYIASAYACYIEYGDSSDLEDDEIEIIDNFLDDLGENLYFVWGEESQFCKCSISGLLSDCLQVAIYKHKKGLRQ